MCKRHCGLGANPNCNQQYVQCFPQTHDCSLINVVTDLQPPMSNDGANGCERVDRDTRPQTAVWILRRKNGQALIGRPAMNSNSISINLIDFSMIEDDS